MNVKKKVWYQIETVGGSRRQKILAVLVLTAINKWPKQGYFKYELNYELFKYELWLNQIWSNIAQLT